MRKSGKKLIVASIGALMLFLVTGLPTAAQSLIDTAGIHSVEVSAGGWPQSTSFTNYIFFQGSRMIQGKEYIEVHETDDISLQKLHPPKLFIREEGGKVFGVRVHNDSNAFMMYDFTLNEGDTLFSDSSEAPFDLVVESVSNIEIEGVMRKRISFGPLYETWIEGIGSTHQVSIPFAQWKVIGLGYRLMCVRKPPYVIYQRPGIDYCHIDTRPPPLAVADEPAIVKSVLFPNPASSRFTVKATAPIESLKIIDASGRCVHQSSGSEVDVSALAEGTYAVWINENVFQRLVVIH